MTIAALAWTEDDLREAGLTILGEARGEIPAGRIAVAWVIRNRASWLPAAWWGHTPALVCTRPWQFSCRNADDPNAGVLAHAPGTALYELCYGVAKQIMLGAYPDPTGGATTYKRVGTAASWDPAVAGFAPRVIGNHAFWRLRPEGRCEALLADPAA